MPYEYNLGGLFGQGFGNLVGGAAQGLTEVLGELKQKKQKEEFMDQLRKSFDEVNFPQGFESWPERLQIEWIKGQRGPSNVAIGNVGESQITDILAGLASPQAKSGIQNAQNKFDPRLYNQEKEIEEISEQPPLRTKLEKMGLQEKDPYIKETEKAINETTEEKESLVTPFDKLDQEIENIKKALQREDLLPITKQKLVDRLDKKEDQLQKLVKEEKLEAKKAIDEINSDYKDVKATKKDIQRSRQLLKSGKLSYPIVNSVAKAFSKGVFGLGLNIDSLLLSPETKELQAIAKRFFKAGKDLFPGRITDADIGIILEMIPDASKSIEGNERILNALEVAADAKELRYNAMRDVIKEHKNRIPGNVETLINEKVGPKLDELYDNFMKIMQGVDLKAMAAESNPLAALGRRLV